MDSKDLVNRFSRHLVNGDAEASMNQIRLKALELAVLIDRECSDSREKSLAITNLEECVFWSSASIARNK